MNTKRPLAFLLVTVMAVALFSAAPVAAQDDCTATAVNTGNANNVDMSEDVSEFGDLNDFQEASTSASAVVAVEQFSSQSNSITENAAGNQNLGVVVQANDNAMDAC